MRPVFPLGKVLIPFLFLFSFQSGVLQAQSPYLAFMDALPADASLVFASADLDSFYARLQQQSAWKYYSKLPRSRKIIDPLLEQLEGLGTVGLKPESLLKLFGNDFALVMFNHEMERPEYAFVLTTRGQREYFDEIFQSIQITAIVYGITLGKEQYKGLTIVSLSSNFHFVDAGKIYLLGNRKSALRRCLDAQISKEKVLSDDPAFVHVRNNGLLNSDFHLFVRDAAQFKEFASFSLSSFLVTGKVMDRLEMRFSLVGETNSAFLNQIRNNALHTAFMPFVPFYSYYVRALSLDYAKDYSSWDRSISWLSRGDNPKTMETFSTIVSSAGSLFGKNAALVCIPYATSTNLCFLFETGKETKENDLVATLWPDRTVKKTGIANRVVYYYDEKGKEDTFNYLVKEGNIVLLADGLNMISAALSAKDGANRMIDSQSYKVAWNNSVTPKNMSLVFNSMRWINVSFSDTHFEMVESLKRISSFITMSWQEPKNKEYFGANLHIRAFPKIPDPPAPKK